MLQRTKGEEPYLYYTEREVNGWFGELLENKMRRFDDTNELYNLAYYVKTAERVPLILAHPFCDKAIALMLFWRLKTYANTQHDAHVSSVDIVEKIRANVYPEVLSYRPQADSNVVVRSLKPYWKIPDRFFDAI